MENINKQTEYGIIDIGSNSVRLLYNGKKYIEVTRLSENMYPDNFLKENSIARTQKAVKDLYTFAKALGAVKIFVFATEAVRCAKNSEAFISAFYKENIKIEILSPEKEAMLGFNGAYNGGICGVLDIGGASAELIIGNNKNIFFSHSLNLGCVKVKDIAENMPFEELNSYLSNQVKNYQAVPFFEELIGIGGTVTSIAAVILKLDSYDPQIVHNSVLNYNDIKECVLKLYNTPAELRKNIKGIHPKRAEVLPYGGLLLLSIMKYLQKESITVSENDNLEGYLAQL